MTTSRRSFIQRGAAVVAGLLGVKLASHTIEPMCPPHGEWNASIHFALRLCLVHSFGVTEFEHNELNFSIQKRAIYPDGSWDYDVVAKMPFYDFRYTSLSATFETDSNLRRNLAAWLGDRFPYPEIKC